MDVARTGIDLITAMSASPLTRFGVQTTPTSPAVERSACPTCGSCSGMFTANSMNCLTEVLGPLAARQRHAPSPRTRAPQEPLPAEAGRLDRGPLPAAGTQLDDAGCAAAFTIAGQAPASSNAMIARHRDGRQRRIRCCICSPPRTGGAGIDFDDRRHRRAEHGVTAVHLQGRAERRSGYHMEDVHRRGRNPCRSWGNWTAQACWIARVHADGARTRRWTMPWLERWDVRRRRMPSSGVRHELFSRRRRAGWRTHGGLQPVERPLGHGARSRCEATAACASVENAYSADGGLADPRAGTLRHRRVRREDGRRRQRHDADIQPDRLGSSESQEEC